MGLLGDSWDDPQSAAIMALAGGLLSGNMGAGVTNYGIAQARGRDDLMRRKFAEQEMQQRIADHQARLQEAAQAQQEKLQAAQRAQTDDAAVRSALQSGAFDPRSFLQSNPNASLSALQNAMQLNSAINPTPKRQVVAPGSSIVEDSPSGPRSVFTAPQAPEKPQAPPEIVRIIEMRYGKDTPAANQALENYIKTRTTHAPPQNVSNTVSIAGPENTYNQKIGGGLADVNLAIVESAKVAPEVIRNAQLIRQSLNNGAIYGTGADVRLSIEKALATAGLIGEGRAADTQALMSGLSKVTLAGVKTSGLGAGNGFTDKDLRFLEQAVSGSIDSTKENLLRVATLSERIATANHSRGKRILDRWQTDPALKAVAQDSQIDPLPEVGQSSKAYPKPPLEAINMLKMNPKMAKFFDDKYGPGASTLILGR